MRLVVAAGPSDCGGPLVWCVPAGRDGRYEALALAENACVIGWSDLGPVSRALSREDLIATMVRVYPDCRGLEVQAGQIYSFIHEIAVGDLVVMPLRTKKGRVAVGRVRGEYRHRDDGAFADSDAQHTRAVHWFASALASHKFDDDLRAAFGRHCTVCEISPRDAAHRILEVVGDSVLAHMKVVMVAAGLPTAIMCVAPGLTAFWIAPTARQTVLGYVGELAFLLALVVAVFVVLLTPSLVERFAGPWTLEDPMPFNAYIRTMYPRASGFPSPQDEALQDVEAAYLRDYEQAGVAWRLLWTVYGLAFVLFTIVFMFAAIYLQAAHEHPWNARNAMCFTGQDRGLSHLDALYYALGTLSTAGTGSLQANSGLCRAITAAQMSLQVALLLVALPLLLVRVAEWMSRRHTSSLG